jgi:AcrR family transcriptional regulator
MGNIARKQRFREEVRCGILDAALKIVQEEGWHALSMRKIGEAIEYTAPIIYGYFENKEAILLELTNQGYRLLCEKMKNARGLHSDPGGQLEEMWLSYWDFAVEEKAYYQLMYGVEMGCCQVQHRTSEMEATREMLNSCIRKIIAGSKTPEADPCRTFYTFWAVVHGLISLNIVGKTELPSEWNRVILRDAIRAIIRNIGEKGGI